MPKTIIFCADGTWNGPGADDNFSDQNAAWTNVFKLFNDLDGKNAVGDTRLADEQERSLAGADGSILQIAKYLHGVGDSNNFLVRILGGTTGAGIITRIVRGYTFISRNYAAGDKIILTGFSRGAYTARALGGLIATRGLLDATRQDLEDKETAYRNGAAVWYAYRKAALQAKATLLDRLEHTIADLPAFLSRPPTAPMVADVPIEAIAVWDTVGALGVPIYVEQDVRADLFRFADSRLSPKVAHGFHAIALDEERDDFVPTFWTPDPRISQVLFPGAHADVGGGYAIAASGLSDGALLWIREELAKLGVRFAANPSFRPAPNPLAASHQPWTELPFSRLPSSFRKFPGNLGLGLSKLLLQRLAAMADYQPQNLGDYLDGRNALAGVTVV